MKKNPKKSKKSSKAEKKKTHVHKIVKQKPKPIHKTTKSHAKPKPAAKPKTAKKAMQPKAPAAPKVEFFAPKGTRDFLPGEMEKRNAVFESIRQVFQKYGYGEVQTPAFESLELLTHKGSLGDEAIKDIYRFTDKSERHLGLRFDPTTPIARIIANSPDLTKPLRWYYITNMWRYEDTGAGRYREFWQAGIELIGPSSQAADAEALQILMESLLALGIDNFVIKINSRLVLDEMARKLKIPEPEKIFRIIDKLGKKEEKEVREELKAAGLSPKQISEVFRLIRSDVSKMRNFPGVREMENIIKLTDEKYRKMVKIDFSIVRGLDYYTGMVFETFIQGGESLRSIASGGRYDSLIERYGGKPTPAVGFGIGIDRIIPILEERGLIKTHRKKAIMVIPVSEEVSGEAIKITASLRTSWPVIMCFADKNLSKNLEYASKKNASFAVIVGPTDLKESMVTVRDMNSGEERKLLTKDITDEIKKWERTKLFY